MGGYDNWKTTNPDDESLGPDDDDDCGDDFDETPYLNCMMCNAALFGGAEGDFGICDDCAEVGAERSRKRREWAECHPGEPCPECELPPMPARKVSP